MPARCRHDDRTRACAGADHPGHDRAGAATGLAVLFVIQVQRVLIWMLVAAFFAVALYPVVAWVAAAAHAGAADRWPRWRCSCVVFLVLGGLLTAFAVPLAQEGTQLAGQLPRIVDDARAGRGPVGDLLDRTNALQWVQDNQDRIRASSPAASTPRR